MEKEQREALIDAGLEVIHAKGFGATGVRDVTSAAGVPHGSFTNHFRSKEAFEVLVFERYVGRVETIMHETLGDSTRTAPERLTSYFERIAEAVAGTDWQLGCMIPDLAAEIGNHSDALRARIGNAITQQSLLIETLVSLIRPEESEDLGAFLLAAWHGTLLRMKVEGNATAVDRFRRVLATALGLSTTKEPSRKN